MPRRRLVLTAPLCLLLWHGGLTWAQGAEAALPAGRAEARQAQELLAAGEFEEAVRTLQKGLKNERTLAPERVELYRLFGLAALYLGNEARARQAYELLLELSPRFEQPKDASPKVRAFFEKIRLERRPDAGTR